MRYGLRGQRGEKESKKQTGCVCEIEGEKCFGEEGEMEIRRVVDGGEDL